MSYGHAIVSTDGNSTAAQLLPLGAAAGLFRPLDKSAGPAWKR